MGASERYIETAVSTQERGKLVVMLYDGAIRFLRIAREKMDRQDWAAKGLYIGKAQGILTELDCCLNMEAGAEIAPPTCGHSAAPGAPPAGEARPPCA